MANSQTVAANAPTPQQVAYRFLQYAREDFSAVQIGTIKSGGAANSQATWDNPVQDYAAWATAVDMMISLPVTITVPAGQGYTVSPYAPFSAANVNLQIGGSESIPPMSLVPFWIDEVTSRRGWEQYDYGPTAGNGPVPVPSDWEVDGSSNSSVLAPSFGGLAAPGASYTNSGSTSVTQDYTLVFYARMILGRNLYFKRSENLAGCVPLGDPASRPNLDFKFTPTPVGDEPENCLLTNAGAGVTCTVGTTAATVTAQWEALTLDQLPPSLGGGIPTPQVMMALEVDTNSGYAIPNAGQFAKLQIRSAMIYHKRIHVVVNDGAPVDPDYFGLWYSDSPANARFAFDGRSNNLQSLYRQVQRTYQRYLPTGVVVADLNGGKFPEAPRETPYRGLITPSVSLAAMANLKPYPASQTVVRIPSGTSIKQAYATTWDFGVVPVAY